MRIPVSVVVGQLARGASVKDVLADFPDLEEADVRQALQYAACLTTEEVRPVQTPRAPAEPRPPERPSLLGLR